MPVHPNRTILSMQTGAAYCNVPSNFSGTHGLHVYLFSISSSSSLQDSFSHIEGKFNDADFNLHIKVCTSCKECRPRPDLIYSHENGILRTAKTGPTLYIGRQTMVFTECKLKFFPIILSIYKTKQTQTRHRMMQHLDCV